MTKRRDDLIRLQMEAPERRYLLELGKIEVADPPDTSDFTRWVQMTASSQRMDEPDKS